MGLFLRLITGLFFPPILLFGFYIVRPREEAVILSFGEFMGVDQVEGIRWRHPVGREIRRISTQDNTLDISSSTVVDFNGNPINISAIVVYRIKDTRKAAIDVANAHKFLEDQAGAIIKGVCSKYPYDHHDGRAVCLKNESEEISTELVSELQDAVNLAGIIVQSVKFNDLAYAPEIAQAMLMRQQAQAFIEARKTIVDGAVSLVKDACDQLEGDGINLSTPSKEQLVTNLLVVLCSGESAQPVVQVQAHSNHG
ncbi:MAG: SPFH domain-containing protein [Gammaproteobacteria bacterium]|nr:SPFH domain-containing protein [Gammaproteobacteria bacterium]